MSLVGTVDWMNWRKKGFPAVMFCPFERRFNSEMCLGEGADEWFFSITLHFLPHWTQYLWLIEFLPHYNVVTNSVVCCCTDSCSSCPFYLVGSKNLFWLIELYSLVSDEEILFGKKNRMWSCAYLSRGWKAASYFKGISADTGRQVCCQSQQWGQLCS